ncbi:carbohydrate kinase family protein [Clostridium frigidicarnis]|uniref:Fructokinase n=1 Tax=Clostridium frigidicarnis TaxID=84698 RepID=A0A1I0XFA7_9CLOT|nr:carbohydrate kinase [Clostridium frigidicarnis]SFA98623.1 fructokinase [Clostridium frigidicarnis]
MFDVTAIGEILIDFTPVGVNEQGYKVFCQNPGGAPANVLVANSKFGGKTAFIGKVGNDSFGKFLIKTLKDANVSTEGIIVDEEVNTTLAFVHLDTNGDRSFSFYRKPGADMMLNSNEINEELIKNCKILHFGSVSLTDEPSRTATLEAVKLAKSMNKIISYDPNYRPLLWDNEELAIKEMVNSIKFADIVKVSEEELFLLTGEKNLEVGSKVIADMGVSLVLVSLGEKGAFYRKNNEFGLVKAYTVDVVDTNGAGDAFLGAIHYCIKNKSLKYIIEMSKNELEKILEFANASGALATTKNGAIPAIPTLNEVNALLNK